LVNGFFGTGGGIVIVALLTFYSLAPEKVFASSNFTILLLSVVSLYFYLKNGTLHSELLPYFFKKSFLPALVGGAVGGILLKRIKGSFLQKLFSVFVIIAGIGRIFK
jgi:uncharacterized membrane protein YfcA